MNAFARFLRRIPTLIATGFGLGYAPVASGTFGALLGCLIVWTMTEHRLSLPLQIAVCAAIALACIPVCTYAEKALGGKKDDGRIVADEYLTFPICMLGLYDKWQDLWWLMRCVRRQPRHGHRQALPRLPPPEAPSGLGIR